MPQSASATKRVRQNEKRRARNRRQLGRVRTKMKTLRELEDADEASALLNEIKSELDRLVGKNVIHENKAANYKSELQQHVNSLG
ncbi:MAG: 30S ribosomal protein S20 [Bacteroidetes bacterium QS_7_67_15]|jgi:small subunit ribosomal protein S20|nr:MAG: 30S ribosomal protein S20 [Bacteroidetes bacterium QH_8_67_23]PSQ82576.1 MAG: 30S ribosomal protein S20 [Bacteroidetes bacterium QS_7_67_15]PSQ93059.1 MAG: 30S ribosomal protein S20 [Bacteroidetes bacterium SW_4_67_19]